MAWPMEEPTATPLQKELVSRLLLRVKFKVDLGPQGRRDPGRRLGTKRTVLTQQCWPSVRTAPAPAPVEPAYQAAGQ